MRIASLSGVLFAVAVLTARTGRASEEEPLRVGAAAVGSYADLRRSATSPRSIGGTALGGELRLHPWSAQGLVAAYTESGGVFGPTVRMVDAGYSYRIMGGRHLSGLTGALYADAGPVVGFVNGAPPARDHTVLGMRASLVADVQLWNLAVGPIAAYRFGVPLSGTPAAWEGAFTLGLRVGLVFDVGSCK